jgi:hypothetical protein
VQRGTGFLPGLERDIGPDRVHGSSFSHRASIQWVAHLRKRLLAGVLLLLGLVSLAVRLDSSIVVGHADLRSAVLSGDAMRRRDLFVAAAIFVPAMQHAMAQRSPVKKRRRDARRNF